MGWTRMMRDFVSRRDTGIDEAHAARRLLAAVLDDGVPDLELGAMLAVLQRRAVSSAQLLGFRDALIERCTPFAVPDAPARPVVLAATGDTGGRPNLLPLVALLLRRLRVPVLIHSALRAGGGITAAAVMRELGIVPCIRHAQAQSELAEGRLAFVPTGMLAPGLARLAAICARLGFSEPVSLLARLVDPFSHASLLVVAAGKAEAELLDAFMAASGINALVLDGTEGEAFADPLRRPAFAHWADGERRLLFEPEAVPLRSLSTLPVAADAAGTAAWTQRALAGEVPVPLPIANQIACCLYGAGYTHDMNQAKAIAAIETGSLTAA